MKKVVLAVAAVAAATGSAAAADLAARPYVRAAVMAPVASWTGFYIFGGGGGGLSNSDSNVQSTGVVGPFGAFGAAGATLTRDQRMGGSGWFGTVGAGYDWKLGANWVAGAFADGQFGELRGSLPDPFAAIEGAEKLRTSYAAGLRLGYLVAPNVLSYVNVGYTGSEWAGTGMTGLRLPLFAGGATLATTPSFRRDGWFIGGGVENSLAIFGVAAPGWSMKTEYRSAFYDRIALPETSLAAFGGSGPLGTAVTFKPWVQTVSTSLVYRFNSTVPTASAPSAASRLYLKAAPQAANWSGFYAFGGAGGGLWSADCGVVSTGVLTAFGPWGPVGAQVYRDQRLGGSGWFGTVGAGYDWQFNSTWVTGVFADGQFGNIRGSLSSAFGAVEDTEKLRTSYAAGVRLGYLVAPNVLSYVNAGYSGSEWSGTNLWDFRVPPFAGGAAQVTTPSFRRDGWFIGGGVENSLNMFGVTSPGWFMKTEYRSAFYDRIALPLTGTPVFIGAGPTGLAATFKPWVQTVSTSLVYRFNSPVIAKY